MSSAFNPDYDMHAWLRNCEEEIIEPIEGKLTGTFPNWMYGTLLRNGPGSLKVGSDEYKHVYDGAALLHRFAIKEGQVTYQCRFLSSDTLKKNRAANRIVVTEFGTKSVPDPCHTISNRISSFFKPLANLTDNAVISVYPFGDQVYAMTEVTNVYKIDPTTLETLEKQNLFDSLIVCHSAHPHVMPNVCYLCTTMGILNILPSSTYKLFKSENTTLNRIMSETELSLIGSISYASSLIVSPFSAYLLDTLGRKGTLMLFYLPQLFSWGLLVTMFRVETFIFSMFVCGLSGSIIMIAPVYITEYCDPCIRGAMSSCSFICLGVGMTMSYLLGGLLDYNTMNYTGLTMTVVGFILICFIKESPMYLMKRGYEEEAAKSIAFYNGIKCDSTEVKKQMANIRSLINADKQMDAEQMLKTDKYKPREKIPKLKYLAESLSTRRALVVVLVLFTSTLFQGKMVVEVYAKPLFEEAVPNMSATLSSIIFGIISVGAGFFGAYLTDTAGRRKLIIVSSIATGLLCVILATHLQFNWGPNWLTAVLLYFYTIMYSVGPAIVPIVLIGEVFLPEICCFASMLCIEWANMCIFIVIFVSNLLFNAYGLCPLFYLFAGSSFISAFFSYIYLPETKGIPVDVIQQRFMPKKNPHT